MAVAATGAQSCFPPALQVGLTEVSLFLDVSTDFVVSVPEGVVVVLGVVVVSGVVEDSGVDEDLGVVEDSGVDEDFGVVDDSGVVVVPGVVVVSTDFEVCVAEAEQGVVGWAVTQTHKALTEFNTWIPVPKPQPPMTQFCALFWMTADDVH